MRLPNLKIAGHEYKTLFPYIYRERSDAVGQQDPDLLELRVVEIDSSGNIKKDTVILQTYFHELFHAINKYYCLGMIGKKFDVEKLIDGLAEGMVQILIDNDLINKERFYDKTPF